MAQKAEEWGKTKFKPTLTRTTQNPFTKPQNFNRTDDNAGFKGRGGKYNGNNRGGGMRMSNHQRGRGKFNRGSSHFKNDKNDRVRFNAIARDAKPEVATPWTKFKDEINYKKREEMHEASQACMNTEEAKNALKQREMKYRRLLMEQKKQETTQWEDFGANEDDYDRNNKSKKTTETSVLFANPLEDKKDKGKYKMKSAFFKEEMSSKGNGFCGNGVREQSNEEVEVGNSEKGEEKSKKYKRVKKLDLQKKSEHQEFAEEVFDSGGKKTKTERKHSQPENPGQPEMDTKDTKGSNSKKFKKLQKQRCNDEVGETSCVPKFKPKPFLTEDKLENFDANKLTFHEKDTLRKVITKSVTLQKGTTFTQRLENRIYQYKCKAKKKKILIKRE